MDYELIVQKVYEIVLRDGDTAIDVGAHVGRHSIPMAKMVAPRGKVFAVEPLPVCQSQLNKTIRNSSLNLEKVITIYPFALSNQESETDFNYVVDDPGYSGLMARTLDRLSTIEKITVQVKTLDKFFSDLNSLKYIKIDAEGGEYNILRGGINLIKKFLPVITFEFGANSYKAYSVVPEEVFHFFSILNYTIFDIKGKILIDENEFAQSSINQHIWDYVAIPSINRKFIEKILAVLKEDQ